MNEDIITFKKNVIAGGVARGLTIFKLYPLDTIKTKIQKGDKFSLYNIKKYYKGITITVFGQIPYYMIVFGTYETLKKKLINNSYNNISASILSATIADFIGSLWLTPNEIIKQKMQTGTINNVNNGIFYIYKKYGFFGFYKGFYSLLLRDIPFRVIKLPLYEIMVNYYVPKNRKINIFETMLIGSSVGMISSGLTNPADVVKTRIMTSKNNVINIRLLIKDIIKNEGYFTFLTGIKYRILYTGFANGLFFTYYEFVKNII